MFYINNYINWNLFNQLYNPDQIEIGIQNADIIAYKLELTLLRATNQNLEITGEKRQKREEIVEIWKTEAMVVKH